ncbi:MAG TPA: ABC transporter permease [Candidatus Saccharimonadales bacterium]
MADVAFEAGSIKPEKRSRLFWAASDSTILIGRSLRHIFRSMDQLLAVVFQPIMFMLLFRYVFGGAIETQGSSYVNFLVPGILIQTAAFGATTTAIGVCNDLQRGIIDRFKSLPMLSSAVLTGHVVADLARNTVSSIVMIGVGLIVGFRPTAGIAEWLAAFGVLLLFTLAFSWLSAILGMVAKTIEGVQWFSFVLIFPLTFASSAFVQPQTMPAALEAFARNQPISHIIESLRALLIGTPMGDHLVMSVVWCVGLLVVSIPLAGWLFRRHTSK